MVFLDLQTDAGLNNLNEYLADRSYIEGYVPSQADNVVFYALSGPPSEKLNHVLRWFNHICSYDANERKGFVGVAKPISAYGPSASNEGNGADEEKEEDVGDEDEIDLFGSDDDDDDEAEKLKQQRLEAYAAKKSKKPGVIPKSNIVLDVKPWDDETDMKKVEECVRSIETDGLLWGASKLVPVGYGIKKLQISCVIEDDKISTDFLEESITAFEDDVQSVDIAAFNKI